jgi:hypothetical protein
VIKKSAFLIILTLFLELFLMSSCAQKHDYKPYSIKEKVQAKWPKFKMCLDDKKKYRGLVAFTWEINSNGKTYNIKTSRDDVRDPKLINCFSRVLETITFSTFGLNYKAKVKSYTFVFSKAKK